MVDRHRIGKRTHSRKAAANKGRGRPKAWSSSWQKRLAMFRLCGLPVEAIVELLNTLNGGLFNAKVRRAQQILREVLSNGYKEFCPRSEMEARARISFFRSSKQIYRTRKRNSVETSSSLRRMSYGKSVFGPSCPDAFPLSPNFTEEALEQHIGAPKPRARRASRMGEKTLGWQDGPSYMATSNSPERFGSSFPTMPRSNERFSPEITSSRFSSLGTDSIISSLSAILRVKEILRRNSYSSSLVSEIMSVLRIKFSTSTCSIKRTPAEDYPTEQRYYRQMLFQDFGMHTQKSKRSGNVVRLPHKS
ncbi:hypothetical protein BU23DRAFT_564985 [Bimuria novae-zelandiae CBS 107.79]|uniref:Uncharacterized protein n=1 Tax=Bimuria novae-zelandiae CBS 107.79 TaxID=1447943 RepID=A0A6A5VLQ9_9PLEO|nr:hypothetical protein BU23DRAFT_564985 [Bimuria novae-zelandiae CBS 107.79]